MSIVTTTSTRQTKLFFPMMIDLPSSRLEVLQLYRSSRACRHLRHIAEDIRTQRQDINRLLADFVKDVNGFRLFMKRTGAIIVGDFATCFFTGEAPTNIYRNSLDLALPNMNTGSCESWISLLKGDIVASGNGCSNNFIDARVCHRQRKHIITEITLLIFRSTNSKPPRRLTISILNFVVPFRSTATRPTDGSFHLSLSQPLPHNPSYCLPCQGLLGQHQG